MPEHAEPTIVINGVVLTDAQAMTLRVALSSFVGELAADPQMMAELGPVGPAYLARGREVERLMLKA